MKKKFSVSIAYLLIFFSIGLAQGKSLVLSDSYLFEKLSPIETTRGFNVAIIKARPFSISNEFFEKGFINVGDNLKLNLFPGLVFESVLQRVSVDVNNTTTFVSKIEGFDFAFAVISVNGGDVLVSVDIPELKQKYTTRLHPVDRSLHLVKLDTRNLDFIEGGHPDDAETKTIDSEKEKKEDNNSSSSVGQKIFGDLLTNQVNSREAEIDILVAFTPNAAVWANSNEGNINNTIANAMAWCNIAAAFSDLGITFNLAFSNMVTYTESGASGTDLSRLRSSTDGHMDIVHEWRNTFNADMVALLTQVSDVGGMAYLLRRRFGDLATGYSITRVQQASNTFTMIHEIGHNMGAHHHANQNFQPGPTIWEDWPGNTWSAGWYWVNNAGAFFCDLMTYSSGQFFNHLGSSIQMGRVPVFSSPRVFHEGIATGNFSVGDNARTLIEVKHLVSKYRDEVSSQYCSATGGNPSSYITRVEAGGWFMDSGNLPFYDYSFINPNVVMGEGIEIKITINTGHPNNQLLAWADWNDDKVFNESEELVFSHTSNSTEFVFIVTPPLNILAGSKRLRLRLNNTLPANNPNASPCGPNGTGEVKDISLNVLPSGCEPVAILRQPSNQTMCRTLGTTTLSIDTQVAESASFQWQFLQNGVWTNIQPGQPTGATYSGENTSTLIVSGISALGSFYYRCIVSNCDGASIEYSRNAIVRTVVNLGQPATITGNVSPCEGLILSYFVPSIENATFLWEVPNDWVITSETTGNGITVLVGQQSGEISVRASNDCGLSPPRTLAVNVAPTPPTPTLTLLAGNVLHSSAPTGNRWFRNNLIILGASGQTFTAVSDGLYHVRVTLGGCNSENSNVIAIGVVSVNETETESSIEIFPNPVTAKLTIKVNDNHFRASYQILNIAGQVIDSANFENKVEIYTQDWAKGMYIVRVISKNGTISRKIVKQ